MLAAVLAAFEARGLVGQALARRGRDAQHVEDALVFGSVVGDHILALRVRDNLAVGLPILLAVAGAPLEVGLGRWRRGRWWEARGKGQRWRRWWSGWVRWTRRRQRARAVVEALDLGRDHGRTLPAQELLVMERELRVFGVYVCVCCIVRINVPEQKIEARVVGTALRWAT